MSKILGISAFYHDSAAALLVDGDIVAAAQEERFTRKKHDLNFPINAAQYCLREAGISIDDLDYVAFYDKPFIKLERLLVNYLTVAPFGWKSYLDQMPHWLKDKLFMRRTIQKNLEYSGDVLFATHHQSHAASAFFPSPFEQAAILTLDGVGEWATSTYGVGKGNKVTLQKVVNYPHSIGLLYSAFTYFCGFKVNSGEYKLMGLAPYGEPVYVDDIKKHLIDIKPDGSYRLNMKYFDYDRGLRMTNSAFAKLFGGPARKPESKMTQREMDLARSVQAVTEEVILKMGEHIHRETGQENLCLAGGVALNCVANGRLLREGPFKNVWIQPAAGDAGNALGCALFTWHQLEDQPRTPDAYRQKATYLGPSFDTREIKEALSEYNAIYNELPDNELTGRVADLLAEGKVVGWFQGRMEFGPRALGARSILGDPRSEEMQSVMNLKIKYRESFRPFAPSVLADNVSDYFDMDTESPYMLLVADVQPSRLKALEGDDRAKAGFDKLRVVRSEIPAITHVDNSARIQTVSKKANPVYYDLIQAFHQRTGCPVVINTSFNVRGEPIVCTPQEAYTCFMRTEMDALVVGNFVMEKADQPTWKQDKEWQQEFELD